MLTILKYLVVKKIETIIVAVLEGPLGLRKWECDLGCAC